VVLAVSGHGFGHAVRSAEVARALVERGVRVVVRTDAPRWLFPHRVEWIEQTAWPLDIGVAQRDGLELDIAETRRRWQSFARSFDEHAEREAQLLRNSEAAILVGDIPPLAFAAASRAGLPALALGNFTWDWIYAAWPGFEDIVSCIRGAYSQAEALLRLPLHARCDGGFAAFTRIEDVPLIARQASRGRMEVRNELGLADQALAVLLSFGGFTARGLNLNRLGQWPTYTFIVTPPLALNAGPLPANVLALNETPSDYVSVLAACDVVVTKPGYGIVADCLANRVAVLFTDRGPFREYDVLASALPAMGRARYVPRDDLISGDLGKHLDALVESQAGWIEQPINGAAVVAERVMQNLTK
jgi:hypothetical protein